MSIDDTAKLCEDFVQYVDSYLLCDEMMRSPGQIGTFDGVLIADAGSTRTGWEARRIACATSLVENSRKLAAALEVLGINSRLVLEIANYAKDPDNGSQRINTEWDLLGGQAKMQQVTIRLRSGHVTNKAKRRRNRHGERSRKPSPLTQRQAEVIQVVGECKGNIAQAARQLGRDRKTIEQTYRAGMEKLGKTVIQSKDKTRLFSRDKRGQALVSDADDRRL